MLVDGTTASMPDTPENQSVFPQSKAQGVGLGFPLVRIVELIALATGVVRDLALGLYRWGSRTSPSRTCRPISGCASAAHPDKADPAVGRAGLEEIGLEPTVARADDRQVREGGLHPLGQAEVPVHSDHRVLGRLVTVDGTLLRAWLVG